MPKLYSSDYIIKVLLQKGFILIARKGRHAKYRLFSRPPLTVIVPIKRKEMPVGTFKSILRQANLSEADFEKKYHSQGDRPVGEIKKII